MGELRGVLEAVADALQRGYFAVPDVAWSGGGPLFDAMPTPQRKLLQSVAAGSAGVAWIGAASAPNRSLVSHSKPLQGFLL